LSWIVFGEVRGLLRMQVSSRRIPMPSFFDESDHLPPSPRASATLAGLVIAFVVAVVAALVVRGMR
jgi:hypothetical protein